MTVEFGVLGAVEAYVDGRPVALGDARQQSVFSALLFDANQPVPVERLADRVWGDGLPRRAAAVLDREVRQLRQLLAPAGGASIARCRGGYLLSVDQALVDLHRFDRLLGEARASGDDEHARSLFAQALALWRGDAFAALDTPWLNAAREKLHRQRFAAELEHVEVRIRLGEHTALLTELADRARVYPLDQHLSGQLMLALHRCSRTGDALAHYEAVRIRLADELGVAPGERLQRLHRDLTAVTVPAGPAVSRSTAEVTASSVRTPRQLPASPSSFVGRTGELSRLSSALPASGDPYGAMAVWAISGTGGVGKTWLALRWAHEHVRSFPDGQLYVNLRGFGPSGAGVDPAVAVRGFLDALGVPAGQVPAGLDAQLGLYRSVLAGKRVLVVLDNARDDEQVRPLLPGSPGCVAIVTSRSRLTGLVTTDGARALSLDLPTEGEARTLLADRLGADRVAAEPDAVSEIISRCARLPLALAIAAARGSAHPEFPLATLAGELRDAARGLDAFEASDTAIDVRTVLSWSHRVLSTDAARLFLLLGLHPGPDLTASAAASLAGIPPDRVHRLLAELTHAYLLTEHAPGRYTFHDLLRAYAVEQATTHDDGQRRAAMHRMLDHYLHTADAARLLAYPRGNPIDVNSPRPGVTVEVLKDRAQAFGWLTAEMAVLLATVDLASRTGFDTHACQLARGVAKFLDRQGRWREIIASQDAASAAATRLRDRPEQARAHRRLASAHMRLGRVPAAHGHLQQALDLSEAIDDHHGQAKCHLYLGLLWEGQGRYTEALSHAYRALELWRATGHQVGQARALNTAGWLHAQLGDYQQALTQCIQALAWQEEVDDRHEVAATLDSIGFAYHHLGRHTEAIAHYERALAYSRESGDRYCEALTLMSLGDTHYATGDPDAARTVWQQVLDILEKLEHLDAGKVRDRLDSLGPARVGDPTTARADHADPAPPEPMTISCVRHGQRWRIEYGHRTLLVGHSVGMLHLAVLLANPNQEVPAIELAAGVAALHNAAASIPHEPVLDPTAIRDYRNRINQLREQIDRLEAKNQVDRAAQARAEYDWLVGELAATTGINGRSRRFPDNKERARLAVGKAIRRSLNQINRADPWFGEHLQNSIHTGTRCSYRP